MFDTLLCGRVECEPHNWVILKSEGNKYLFYCTHCLNTKVKYLENDNLFDTPSVSEDINGDLMKCVKDLDECCEELKELKDL